MTILLSEAGHCYGGILRYSLDDHAPLIRNEYLPALGELVFDINVWDRPRITREHYEPIGDEL